MSERKVGDWGCCVVVGFLAEHSGCINIIYSTENKQPVMCRDQLYLLQLSGGKTRASRSGLITHLLRYKDFNYVMPSFITELYYIVVVEVK